jgi:1,4-alpha-glucan branching enzyme
MSKGYLTLILHAHLPYIRHPEHEYFLEENWLYEAIVESYIPLLDVFDSLLNDNIDFRITLSLSPTIVEMFDDELLQKRCLRYIDNLIGLSEKEIIRTKGDPSSEPLAIMYNERFKRIRYLYEESYKRDLTSIFKKLQDSGKVEILTTAATHAYLPTLSLYPHAVKAQIKVAIENHIKNFGRKPAGIWLPECGYYPDLDKLLKETEIKFFFVETHGILNGIPTPRYGTYNPIICPSSVVAFGRDIESSKEVWSSIEGYPGDPVYRDFYRDIGFDLETKDLKPFIHPDKIRTYTGIKYYRITDKTDIKLPYVREHAISKAEEHAERFILNRERHIEFLNATVNFNPVITAPYDMELFGHWWFEGPEWLNFVLRKVAKQNVFKMTTPSEYLCQNLEFRCIQPAMSSWGNKGYNEVWLNHTNNWIYRHIHKAVERMIEISNLHPDSNGLLQRAMNQAAREILLSQHSDWAFLMKAGTASEYAKRRITEHIEMFTKLYESIKSNNLDEKLLLEIEAKDSIFSEIDYRVYSDHERSLSKG